MPQLDRRNRSWWRLLDERSATGGRAKAWLFLTHPGPSLLVTALAVAAAALLTRRAPSPRLAGGLVALMLPAQLAIGALNDWADVRLDSVAKPFKPIPRGLVPRRAALVLAVAGFSVSLAAAAWLGPGVLGVDLLVVAAGASYDLLLKRTPAAVLAWWAGFAALPLVAMAATGALRGAVAAVPLAGLLALALLLANGLPDAEGDRRDGALTLPVLLGARRGRLVEAVCLLLAAAYVAALGGVFGQGGGALAAAALLALAALLPATQRATSRVAFPALALLLAAATVSWLAALPSPGPG